MNKSPVQSTLERLAKRLDQEGIPYAVIDGMALNVHGYVRVTRDVDVLLRPDGLETFVRLCAGRGYAAAFPGASRAFIDAESRVPIEIITAGEYPGDGKPKPVAFPDPAVAAVRGRRVALLPLDRLIELKLASGMSAPHRLKDLADVLELVRILSLPLERATSLDASVRDKYRELWHAAQAPESE